MQITGRAIFLATAVWLVLACCVAFTDAADAVTMGNGTTETEVRFGDWLFFSSVAEKGTPFCSVGSAVKSEDSGQNVFIKHFNNTQHLNIFLYDDRWTFAKGQQIDITLDFGDNEPLILSAYGDDHGLEAIIPTSITAVFLLILSERPQMTITFAGRADLPWVITGRGAREAVQKMVNCMM